MNENFMKDTTSSNSQLFQHTATRRWLRRLLSWYKLITCFNTQPPEGGCIIKGISKIIIKGFNTQPPEGGCDDTIVPISSLKSFNTQPPEGGCNLDNNGYFWVDEFQHTATRRWLLEHT